MRKNRGANDGDGMAHKSDDMAGRRIPSAGEMQGLDGEQKTDRDSTPAVESARGQRHAPSASALASAAVEGEFHLVLDPGRDFDPEGWMAEHGDHRAESGRPAKLGALAWCAMAARRIAASIASALSRLDPSPSARRRARMEVASEFTSEDWARLSETALGPLRPTAPVSTDGPSPAPLDFSPLASEWRAGDFIVIDGSSRSFGDGISIVAGGTEPEDGVAPDAPTLPEKAPIPKPRKRRP